MYTLKEFTMLTIISKWGNSLALRIPQALANQLGIVENTNVTLELDGDQLIIRRGQTLENMLAAITDKNKHSPQLDDARLGKEMI
jgi:antitoxin MazE